jgi:RecB family exonuclease
VTISVSNSEIQAFKRCKRKWWLTYYRRLQRNREDGFGPRAIGNRVHAALAAYYDVEPTDAFSVHDELLAVDLENFPEDTDKIVKEGLLSRIMLEGYFEWLEETGADEGLTVTGVETELQAVLEIKGQPVTIRGKLDKRLVREIDGARRFLDHKTVQEFTTPAKVLDIDEQFLMYELLEVLSGATDMDDPGRVDGGIYNMLRKVKRSATAKPPFYMRLEISHNAATLRAFYERLHGELHDLMTARERLDAGESHQAVAYPTPTRDCPWQCDFFAVCHLVNDPSADADHIISVAYSEGDPYARYDSHSSQDGETVG